MCKNTTLMMYFINYTTRNISMNLDDIDNVAAQLFALAALSQEIKFQNIETAMELARQHQSTNFLHLY